jgi:FAD synthase
MASCSSHKVITGTFDGKHTGHMGAFSGELIVKEVSPVWTGTVPADLKDSSNPVSCK